MTPSPPSSSSAAVLIFLLLVFDLQLPAAHSLGTGSTLAVSDTSLTVCGISADQSIHSVKCYSHRDGRIFTLSPATASFSSLSGGNHSLCGLRSSGYSILCWDNLSSSASTLSPKRIYYSAAKVLSTISLGESHLCGLLNGTHELICLRGGNSFRLPPKDETFSQVSSGFGFSCGISTNSFAIRCWGSNSIEIV